MPIDASQLFPKYVVERFLLQVDLLHPRLIPCRIRRSGDSIPELSACRQLHCRDDIAKGVPKSYDTVASGRRDSPTGFPRLSIATYASPSHRSVQSLAPCQRKTWPLMRRQPLSMDSSFAISSSVSGSSVTATRLERRFRSFVDIGIGT